MKKTSIVSMAAAALLSGGILIAPTAAAESVARPMACTMDARVPSTLTGSGAPRLQARAYRSGCSNSPPIEVKGMRHRTLEPDQTIVLTNYDGWKNGWRKPTGACSASDDRPFEAYTETNGGGHGQVDSVNGERC